MNSMIILAVCFVVTLIIGVPVVGAGALQYGGMPFSAGYLTVFAGSENADGF